jgi:exosortase
MGPGPQQPREASLTKEGDAIGLSPSSCPAGPQVRGGRQVGSLVFIREWWRPILLALLLATLYWPVGTRLVSQWFRDPGNSHGFLVPFFAAYVIWLKHKQLARAAREPTVLGLWIVLGGIGLLFVGSIAAEQYVSRVSFVIVLWGLVLFFWGWGRARLLAFPISFLILMIPIPAILYNAVVFPLQLISSRLATKSLITINVMPIYREGNILILPNCTLEVVEACSGIRSLLSLVTLAVAYGYVAEQNLGVRTLLALAMVPVSILGNGARVTLAALMAHYRGPEALEGFLHPLSSLVIVATAALSLLLLHYATKTVAKGLRVLIRP